MGVLLFFIAIGAGLAEELSFNRDIRPILSEQCFQCHGPDANNRKTGLRLDNEEAAKTALKNGHVGVVAGQPETSGVMQRVTHRSKALRMPPAYAGKDPLPEKDIEKLRQWIASGAKYEPHWAFLPPKKVALPEVKNKDWAAGAIDRFVLAKLEANGMAASPEASRPALLRRLSFDLTGLPTTPEEVRAFVADGSANAYEKQVDRLLASPRYGERMAWRWLEAARYADTNGYQSDGVRDMYRWRDWVIESFAANQPFDRFIVEQLAGDLLPNPTLEQRIATAFHRNHRTSAEGGIVPEEFRVEYVADRAETTATVFLGMTMGCARCHDHKYDPIPQKDFYRMFAFFNNLPEKGLVYNWGNDEPLMKAPTREQQRTLAELDTKLDTARRAVERMEKKIRAEQARWEKQVDGKAETWMPEEGLAYQNPLAGDAGRFDGQRVVEEKGGTVVLDYLTPFTFSAWVKSEKETGAILGITEDYAEGNGHGLYLMGGKLRLHVVFRWTDIGMRLETKEKLPLGEMLHVAVTYDGSRYAKGVHIYVNGEEKPVDVLFDELNWPMNFKYPLRIGAASGLRFAGRIEDVRIYKRALSREETLSLWDRKPLGAGSRPEKMRLAFLERGASAEIRGAMAERRRAEEARAAFWKSLPSVMVMEEGPKRPAFLLRRGAYDAPGEAVEPGTPTALPAMPAEAPKNRLGLAEWLVARENPLTARVAVNRFWQMLFGVGLVKTVEDFGSQGEWPLHQDLLDWLAVDFRDSGWDVKRLLKQMVMSAAYRQSSVVTPEVLARDPENRLLARGVRQRLGPEMIRDNALAVAGLLVEKQGGPSVKPYQVAGLWQELSGGGGYPQDHGEGLYRRSLYTFWKRTVAPPVMVNFDSPNREVCTVRETRTNTPLQALNLMNDVTFLEAARKLAERVLRMETEEGKRIDLAYELVLSRRPKAEEARVVARALERFRARYRTVPKDADAVLDEGEAPLPRRMDRKELAAWATVSSLLLNLDEAVTKQ